MPAMAGNQSDLNPFRRWESSQKGLLDEPPQRHNFTYFVRVTVRPVPEQISIGPLSLSGPFFTGLSCSSPPRSDSGSEETVLGSPVASNAASMCELSR